MAYFSKIIIPALILCANALYGATIVNGVPWHDDRDSIVSAHGANIIKDNGRYYMFGEFKTDSANVFTGFSCYLSADLENWRYEGIALGQQTDGRLGPGRVGERPKVLRCPATGEYVMIMHSDNLRYKDPCTAYATAKSITGPYTFQGPLLYKGKPVKKWDIGSFVDVDGTAYLLAHHGDIYRFAPDYHSLDSCMSKNVAGVGESPAMLRHKGKYYWFSSHTTSWERNDNMYVSSESLSGPWEKHELFAPQGTNTWNSQTTFILPLDSTFVFMGDRWSFPRQRSAATYVWLPIQWINGEPFLPEYFEAWDTSTLTAAKLNTKPLSKSAWQGSKPGVTKSYKINLDGNGKIYIKGSTDSASSYAEVEITDSKGEKIVETTVDFYSLAPADGLRYISPRLDKGKYTLKIKVSEMKPNWSDKKRNQFGSTGYKVNISEIGRIE